MRRILYIFTITAVSACITAFLWFFEDIMKFIARHGDVFYPSMIFIVVWAFLYAMTCKINTK